MTSLSLFQRTIQLAMTVKLQSTNTIITDIEDVARKDLKFKSKYGHPLKDVWNGHGLEDDLEGCGTENAPGNIKIRPVWRRIGTDGKSLNPMYRAAKNRLTSGLFGLLIDLTEQPLIIHRSIHNNKSGILNILNDLRLHAGISVNFNRV